MTQRRDFLKQVGLLSAVSLAAPGLLLAAPAAPKVGLQLYSLREYIGKDVKGTLAKVAKAGYQTVETYGYSRDTHFWGLTAPEFKAALAANGLTTTSGHYDLGSFMSTGNEDDLTAYIQAAKASGQTYVIVPYLDAKVRTSVADFKAIAAKLNQAGARCKAAGLRLAYHNHDFEFKAIDGTMLYDVMLKETDPALVDFEMDLYWVVRAGHDPLALFKQHPGRFPLWHVKDMDKAKPELNTEVGAGSIDFKKIFAHASEAGFKHPFVEQENFGMDAYQSIAQSAAYIKKSLLPALK
ncbi:MAG: sugar phosphate isomerase/epimerase [Hymenobacter sp.]|nr:MAG: sugar phosphate isomerase/epimerase [Hymenobacter sp.]